MDSSKTNASTDSLRELIIGALKERNLYRDNLVYRGFNRRLLDTVLIYGGENPKSRFIYANPEEFLDINPDPTWLNPLHYAKTYGYGALAVYRTDKLKEVCFTCYEFPDLDKKSESLVAVFTLEF